MRRYALMEKKPPGWYWLDWDNAPYMEKYILKWIETEEGDCWIDYRNRELSTLYPPEFCVGPIEEPKEIYYARVD